MSASRFNVSLGRWLLCFGLLAGLMVPMVSAKDKGLNILITADAIKSPEGFRPKPDKPIYYILFQTRQTLGTVIGGVKLPSQEAVEQAIVAELKKQGFIKTELGGPVPDIVVLAVVGDSNFKDEDPMGNPWNEDDLRMYLQGLSVRAVASKMGWDTTSVPSSAQELFNNGDEPYAGTGLQRAMVEEARKLRNRDPARKRREVMNIIGAKKADLAMQAGTMSDSTARRIADAAFNDQYYLSLSALEAKKQPDGGRAFLWRTTMLIDWREDFGKVLPAMLAEAGPLIGTDVAVPGYVNTLDKRRADVQIGEAKVVADPASAAKPAPKK